MKNSLISIIVPVYNSEKWIEKCVDSLLKQTYQNIEILLINDWSTDSSLEVIKNLSKRNKNIKILSHINHGVWYTRNVWIKESKWEYITFIDADDRLDANFLETLYKEIWNNDIVISWYKQVDINDNLIFKRRLKPKYESRFRQMVVRWKLYKREFLVRKNIYFNELKIWEDISFSRCCYVNTKKIKVINYVWYNSLTHIESATHNISLWKQNTTLEIFKKIGELSNESFLRDNIKSVNFFFLKEFANWILSKVWILSKKDLLNLWNINRLRLKNFYKTKRLKLFFHYNNTEPFKINLATYFIYLLMKLRLYWVLVFLLKIIK